MFTGLQIRLRIWKLYFLFLKQYICCGYSKEPSLLECSFEHQKHMFNLMGKKLHVFTIICLNICLSGRSYVFNYKLLSKGLRNTDLNHTLMWGSFNANFVHTSNRRESFRSGKILQKWENRSSKIASYTFLK